MIHYVKGDLFTTKANIIAHGVNCSGGFGSGIAGMIAKKYPEARKAYFLQHTKFGGWKLGMVQTLLIDKGPVIANCATQQFYGPGDKVYLDYDALRACMKTLKSIAIQTRRSIAMPKIGAGLAGGDWKKIKKILEEVFTDYDATVYYL